MGGFPNEGKSARVLAAFQSGNCSTVEDVEVELGFTLTRHQIAGHVSTLMKRGALEKVGEYRTAGGIRAYRYKPVGRKAGA